MPDPAPARGPAPRAAAHRRLVVFVTDARGRRVPARGLASWLRRVAPARARGTVNVALVSDARMRELNRRFRRIDRATDVLSFPAEPERRRLAGSTASAFLLGDIVIAQGVARRQAGAAGHDQSTELRILALHGLLHLLGYDHERDDGRMLRTERRLRKRG